MSNGAACLIPLPHWIYVDERDAPMIVTQRIGSFLVRFYPPFRNAPVEFLYVFPFGDVRAIPFPPNIETGPFEVPDKTVAFPRIDDPTAVYATHGPEFSLKGAPLGVPPCDSLRLDIYGIKNWVDEASGVVAPLVRGLLDIVRWKTEQCWLGHSNDSLCTMGPTVFPVDDRGTFLRTRTQTSNVVRAVTMSGREKPLSQKIWMESIDCLARNEVPPLPDLLLLDAIHHCRAGQLKRSVLDGAMAVELAKDECFQRLWRLRGKGEFDRDIALGNWDIRKHLNSRMKAHFGCSYKDDFPEHYDRIASLWDARGNAAHAGPLVFGEARRPVSAVTLKPMLSSCRHCIEWLRQLD